jgi:hypothetical protein
MGVSVGLGEAPSLNDVRGQAPLVAPTGGFMPVPVVPEDCR